MPNPSRSLCQSALQCWGIQAVLGGRWRGVGATPPVSPCPQEEGVGGQPAPLGTRGGRSGSGGVGGCSEQVMGTPRLLQWEGSQHHPHRVFSPPPVSQHPEGAGWAGGRSGGGHVRPAQPSPFPLGKSWLPACPSSRVCSHFFPKHQGLCCPLPHASSAWWSPASPQGPGPACAVP